MIRSPTGSPPVWDARKTRTFRRLLLDWYRLHRRSLPWRDQPDPYRVWISEIMLQQTQVQSVLPYFQSFVKRFPSIRVLAGAREDEVVRQWAGLGYYARARNLHRAASTIVEKHGGEFPSDPGAILALPGIGRYTAGAILSIAFNRPEPIVDGNVRRVISRLHAIVNQPPESFFWEQARAWIPADRAADFNQAVMELGALVCTPSAPRCPSCPVRSVCEARRLGIQSTVPAPRKTRAVESVRLVMLVAEKDGEFLVVRHREPEYIPGKWGLPTRTLTGDEGPGQTAARMARGLLGTSAHPVEKPAVHHGITYRKIHIHVYHLNLNGRKRRPGARRGLRWIRGHALSRFITSSLFRKALDSATLNE